jgi:hypothetical protein
MKTTIHNVHRYWNEEKKKGGFKFGVATKNQANIS